MRIVEKDLNLECRCLSKANKSARHGIAQTVRGCEMKVKEKGSVVFSIASSLDRGRAGWMAKRRQSELGEHVKSSHFLGSVSEPVSVVTSDNVTCDMRCVTAG